MDPTLNEERCADSIIYVYVIKINLKEIKLLIDK